MIVDIAAAVNMVVMENIKYLALRHLKQFDQQFLIYTSELFNQCLPLLLSMLNAYFYIVERTDPRQRLSSRGTLRHHARWLHSQLAAHSTRKEHH